MLTNAGDVAYRYDFLTQRFDYVSPEITRLLGFSVDEMLAMDVAETVERLHVADTSTVQTSLQSIHASDGTILHYRFRARDERYRWLADHYQIVTDAEERPRYRMGVMRDITVQKTWQQRWHRLHRVRNAYAAIPRALDHVLSRPQRTFLRKHGFKLAAIAAALVQLVAGAGIYRSAERVISHTHAPTIRMANEVPEATGSSLYPALQQEVERLAMERDRLQRRVAVLEERMMQVSIELTTVRAQQVAAATTGMPPQPAARKAWLVSRAPQSDLPWVRTRGWFAGPALQPIAADPPSSR